MASAGRPAGGDRTKIILATGPICSFEGQAVYFPSAQRGARFLRAWIAAHPAARWRVTADAEAVDSLFQYARKNIRPLGRSGKQFLRSIGSTGWNAASTDLLAAVPWIAYLGFAEGLLSIDLRTRNQRIVACDLQHVHLHLKLDADRALARQIARQCGLRRMGARLSAKLCVDKSVVPRRKWPAARRGPELTSDV